MKPLINSALKYFALFILVYGVLTGISLIPKVGATFNQLYRLPTAPVLQMLLPKSYLQLRPESTSPDVIWVEFASRQQVEQQMAQAGQAGQEMANITGRNNKFSFYNLFLSFFLFFAALILLSPITWKGKIINLLIGTVLFYFYTVFKLYLSMLSIFNEPEIAIYSTGEGLLKFSRGILYFMTLGTNVLVVLLIWAALVLKKNNWAALLKTP